ncbi:SCO7613 C-terminal domain-containing membrane protein [Agromyces sp. NPDC004153]
MTDRPSSVEARGIRRWPADPAWLVDTTRCPACFSPLASTRCDVCGLDVAVPAAAELFRLATEIYEDEQARRSFIDRMRSDQAAREAVAAMPDAASPIAIPVPPPLPDTGVAVQAVPPPLPDAGVAPQVVPPPLPPQDVAEPITSPEATTPARRRSGVQVLLLTLGVVLISVAAIVFLFVAYLVANLEVRSVIIAAASILVLGVAWLLRARSLPGTAEGVASVAVVLLLLDVWIVRANALFGSDALEASAYTGIALAVVTALLAGTRVVSRIRVPGFAAAALAPVSAFLLAFSIDPDSGAGPWLGGLAVVVVGAVAVWLLPRSPERIILCSAGLVGAAIALASAAWAFPGLAWGQAWAFLAVAAACVVLVVATLAARVPAARAWGVVAAVGAGAAMALAPAVGIATELDEGVSTWLAPAAAGAVAAVFAAVTRGPAIVRRPALVAMIAAATVAAVASIQGPFLVCATIFERLLASDPPWQVDHGSVIRWTSETNLDAATILVPFVIAVGSLVVLLLMGAARKLLAIPVAAALVGGIIGGAMAPGAALPVAILVAVGVVALGFAALRDRLTAPGLLAVLAILGMGAVAFAWWIGWSNEDVWPWATAVVLATVIAGRVLASRVWAELAAQIVGAAHLVLAVVIVAVTSFAIPSWLDASGVEVADPWTSSWLWLGTVAAVLLGAFVFAPRLVTRDRLALATPALAAAVVGAFAVALPAALVGVVILGWLPAAIVAVVTSVGTRLVEARLLRILLAATGPVMIALALERVLASIPDAPPSVLGAAAGVLAAAGLAPLVLPADGGVRLAWRASVGVSGVVTLAAIGSAGDQAWLLLLVLAPVPIILAALDGDPIGGASETRHFSWLSLALAVAAVWARLSGEGVDDIEAYTLPLAVGLAIAAGLVTWRRAASATATAIGRTALFAAAAGVAVLPSVASAADSELRTLVLVAAGTIVALASSFLPERGRGVPIRLLGVATGWVALTGAAVVRGGAVGTGASSDLPAEFWPVLALAAGVALAVIWARTDSRPAVIAEAMLAASVVVAAVPTLLAIIAGDRSALRAVVLFSALAVVHVAGAAVKARPFAGPMLAWSSLGVLVLGGILALVSGEVDPFDLVTAPVGVALIGAGAIRMTRSPELGSWPALGPGLAVLLVPPLLADFIDSDLWRLIALGIAASAAVVIGAVRRLQAPLLLGGSVLLVHAVAQLWPWIRTAYEAVWWWLWLGIAGAILIALAATYERQLRLLKGVVRTIADLR